MNRRTSRSDPPGRALSDREQEIARRVRRALHLRPSMPEREVARQFRGSVAWRRARMGLLGEEMRDGLVNAVRPLLRRAGRLWARLWD